VNDIFQNLYNGILRFSPLRKHVKFRSNRKGVFPTVGFLDISKKEELERVLGVTIENVEYFEQSLIHRSYLQVLEDQGVLSNERLEFLGDAVLGMVTAEYLFSLHTNVYEGELTKMRSWIVNKHTLALCAQKIHLDKFVMLSFSAEKSLQTGSESILADCLEAVIAAIYLDSGLSVAKKFIINSLMPIMMNKEIMTDDNYKSLLLEHIQAQYKESPEYEVVEEIGPDHDKLFKVCVKVKGNKIATGDGRSKKKAEQDAAKRALQKLNNQ
jgi:ribonuclease III